MNIELGKWYWVEYADPNYPCNCHCHDPLQNVMHIMPCCYDQSYRGPALAIKDFEDETYGFEKGLKRQQKIRLHKDRALYEGEWNFQPVVFYDFCG